MGDILFPCFVLFFIGFQYILIHDSSLQIPYDVSYEISVFNVILQEFYQPFVLDVIKASSYKDPLVHKTLCLPYPSAIQDWKSMRPPKYP